MSSSDKTNFGCASVRENSITYENNDSCKQRLVIVRTLHIEYDFSLKGEFRVQHKLGSNERVLNFQKNESSLTFIRQLVLEISRLKVKNMDVAIFLISSLIFV